MNKMKFERLKRNLTQKQLSEKLGIDHSCISRSECGMSKLYPSHAQRLAEFFGCKESELLEEIQ